MGPPLPDSVLAGEIGGIGLSVDGASGFGHMRGMISELIRVVSTACRTVGLLLVIGSGLPVLSASSGPLKVFLLVGQSNMQGHAHVRTFEHMGMDPRTAPLLGAMQENGRPKVCESVWIASLSSGGERHGPLTAGYGASEEKIGPEFTFGIHMGQALAEPILILKTAWGGRSLHTDFRPPSAGAFRFNETQLERFRRQDKDLEAIRREKGKATGRSYREMIRFVRKTLADLKEVYPDYDPQSGYDLAGLVWFQGWNDMVDRAVYPNRGEPGGYDAYSRLLAHFIRDVRRDLSVPALPVVIGVMGVGGPIELYLPDQQRYAGIHQHFRDAMAAPSTLAKFEDSVVAVRTERFWDQELKQLRAKEATLRARLKEARSGTSLGGDALSQLQETLRTQLFEPREWETLKAGVSNQEYHYLGSAKIIAQIGKAFAESMVTVINR